MIADPIGNLYHYALVFKLHVSNKDAETIMKIIHIGIQNIVQICVVSVAYLYWKDRR